MFGSNVNYFDTGVGRPDWEDVIQDPVFIQDVAELGITNLRFPGGTFSNYYDFSIGKGYIDWGEKSDQYNWTGITTDQFLQFLHDTGIPHAMITANVYKSGYKYWPGDNWISAQVAADWVDYFNHKSGFRVEYWELGNEVFYNGQIPWWNDPQVPGLTQDLYIQKIHEWSRAMQAVDPTIKIGASVEFPMPSGDLQAWWTLPIIQENAKDIDFLIVHPYVRVNDYMVDGKYVDSTAANAYAWIWATKPIVALRGWLDAYAPSRSKAIEIQASEWAVIAFPENPDTHSDTMLNAVLTTDLFWDMVNEGVDGANLYSLCSWGFQTLESVSGGRKFAQYHIMWMNRHRSGKRLVESQMTSPTYSVDPLGGDKSNGRVDGVPYLSAYATLNDDKSRLYLIITNKSGELQPAIINLDGFTPQSRASVWQMTSARWDDTGMQPVTSMITNGTSTFTYTFPARSVTSFIFEVQPG
jgi:alpha-L-arabinofuranosidase